MGNTFDDTVSLTDAWLNSSHDPAFGTATDQYLDIGSSIPSFEEPSLLDEDNDIWSFFDSTYSSSSLDIATSLDFPYPADTLQRLSETHPLTKFSPLPSTQPVGSDTNTSWLEPAYASSTTLPSPTFASSTNSSLTFETVPTKLDLEILYSADQQPLLYKNPSSVSTDNSPSRLNHGSSCSEASSPQTSDSTKNIKATEASNPAAISNENVAKVPRKRGRKRSNISPEERRSLRLARGRKAANKCRKKRREMEDNLQNKANTLIFERDTMQHISDGLIEDV